VSIRVLVADDHPIVRHGVCALLSAAPDFVVVGEASSGRTAVEGAAASQPDVVVLDLTMPYADDLPSTRTSATGLDAIAAIRSLSGPRVPAVVVLSVHGEVDTVRPALAAGAVGYVLKESVTSDLCTAVRAASAGNVYLSSEVAAVLAPAAERLSSPADRLSPREREVVELIVEGLSSKEIAGALHTSPKTVEKQRRDAMRKLGVSNVATLVRVALDQDL
jgi:DNA-binding NarL/FixJ family response regulator